MTKENPAKHAEKWGDETMAGVIGTLLRAGVILSAAVVLLGGIMYLVRYGHIRPDYKVFRGEPAELRSVSPDYS